MLLFELRPATATSLVDTIEFDNYGKVNNASDECPVQVRWLQLPTTGGVRIIMMPIMILLQYPKFYTTAILWLPGWEL